MTLGWGGLPLLSSLIGPTRAKRALFANERIGGQDALHMGLCDKFSPAGGAVETASASRRPSLNARPWACG